LSTRMLTVLLRGVGAPAKDNAGEEDDAVEEDHAVEEDNAAEEDKAAEPNRRHGAGGETARVRHGEMTWSARRKTKGPTGLLAPADNRGECVCPQPPATAFTCACVTSTRHAHDEKPFESLCQCDRDPNGFVLRKIDLRKPTNHE
jgi:hypothetical protein